jgi:MFS family permease
MTSVLRGTKEDPGTPSRSGTQGFAWRFVTPLFVGSALNPINSALIATALVPIALAMHVSAGRTTVLVSSLYLASSIAQPTAGKLAEEFGPRRVFLTGILIVLVGGIVGGTGQTLFALTISRVLIGIGTSAGYPSAMLLIRRRAEHEGLDAPPGGVLAGLIIAGTVTAAVGLPLGGVLVGAWGWRTAFLVNVPVALVALAMAARWIPRDRPVVGQTRFTLLAARIDLGGIVAFGGAMSALLIFLFSLSHPNWPALATALVLFVVLVSWELRAERPFLDVRLLASNGALTRTYIRFALTNLCIYTVLYGVTEWLEAAHGISSREAGLLQLPMNGVAVILVWPISKRNLIRGPLIAASGCAIVASVGVLMLTSQTSILGIIAVTVIFGITFSTSGSGNQTALYSQVPSAQVGTASGLMRTASYIGSITSSAIVSIVFHNHVTDHGLHVIAVIMIAASAIALLLTVLDRQLLTTPRLER